ncbi:MAG: hypothetical protein K9H64_08915 [Bacteroidales bacterium]|nr:hypothetical protein [Bacteroidales bacterium]MCF8455986.1 hypothetical protein [Bacteroidales bacterium]
MTKTKSTIAWVLAVLITLLAAFYQKTTGPTYPRKEKLAINNSEYTLKLLRSASIGEGARNEFEIPDQSVSARLYYRPYPTRDAWTEMSFTRDGDKLSAVLPDLPPAGKYEYYITFYTDNEEVNIAHDYPIVIRFKGAVPASILIPHIIFIFFAMLFANASGILVLFKGPKYKLYMYITFVLLILGGLIFGPIVQKYAFGEYWTGVPFGWDLTDNKTLIAFLAWAAAILGNIKKDRPWLALLAAIVVLAVFSIPHSMFGSELDPNSGQIIQG